eukprot:11050107-Lingulodinium_polyedra.AAC.1
MNARCASACPQTCTGKRVGGRPGAGINGPKLGARVAREFNDAVRNATTTPPCGVFPRQRSPTCSPAAARARQGC